MAKHILYVCVVLLLLSNISLAQTAAEIKRASDLFKQGTEKYTKGQYDLAIADYSEYLKIRQNVASAWYNRGLAYFQKAESNPSRIDYEKAAADITQAIKLDPKDKDYFINRGMVYARLMRVDFTRSLKLAIDDYTQAIKLDPQSAAAYSGRSQVYEESNQLDLAFADASRSIRLDPKDAVPYYIRAKVYSFRKNYAAARADLETALRIYPGYAQARIQLDYVNGEASKPANVTTTAKTPTNPPTSAVTDIVSADDGYKQTEEAERSGNNAKVVTMATRSLQLIPMIGENLPKVDFDTVVYMALLRKRAKALSAMGNYVDSDHDYKEMGMTSLHNVNRQLASATETLRRDKYGSPAGWVLAEVEAFKGVTICRPGVEGMKEWVAAVERTRPKDMSVSLQAAIMLAAVRESCALALINYGDYHSGADADAAKRTKQLNEALAIYDEAAQLSKLDPRVYLGRAKIYRKLGRNDLADADEQKSRELASKKN